MSGPDKIWLDPECYSDADYVIDRCWHGEKPDACGDCGMEPVEYIRADSTPDPAQIRADAIREAIWAAFKAGVGQGSEEATSYEWGTAPQQSRQQAFDDFMADWNEDSAYLRALLATPLSPTAVDGSPAPDAGGKL